jgi:hypothetical protein
MEQSIDVSGKALGNKCPNTQSVGNYLRVAGISVNLSRFLRPMEANVRKFATFNGYSIAIVIRKRKNLLREG